MSVTVLPLAPGAQAARCATTCSAAATSSGRDEARRTVIQLAADDGLLEQLLTSMRGQSTSRQRMKPSRMLISSRMVQRCRASTGCQSGGPIAVGNIPAKHNLPDLRTGRRGPDLS
jgi:hypothetical protein